MSASRKFGAFTGVFTPSILTILGVIMYMRLGWVVGQAGLLAALGVVLIAHVISVSTGLSISSIATDKKIETGGIYYMLSRSLGLPMGGAIGITIFLGTAMSISLYIIGFCENFLGIEAISSLTGLESTIDNYRLVGTIVILFLVILAFISTSLALKSQHIVLTAIVLSLVSIVVGLLINKDPGGTVISTPAPEGVPLEVVFGVFFPAVTGFTAGVALSGDLKDPRRAIPIGTIGAIVVGLIVYVGLTVVYAMLMGRETLLTDNNFLLKVAWFSPLVIAGIWGATLSSALGGILGAPRILQAISKDRITPGIFAKGYGATNEPRNALIITFLIAEAGILIGELNVVARIVTMFYIAAYGFINMSYALESWASSDFRPSFRIPRWVAVIGFIACFGVMFKMDTLAMILALIFMLGIYFLLKRKELRLDLGDVWLSVWSSIVRSSLHRMDKRRLEERNWQPNIILFSGGTQARPYLVDFGKNLVGKLGFLSNFDLIEKKDPKGTELKHQQAQFTEVSQKHEGIFSRQHTCNDVYEGIETIAQTYGFSGIEPNTVMLGWAKQSKNPSRFARTLKKLSDMDYNVLLMDYDKTRGFGKKQKIDIWCRGQGNNCNLALSLVKFIWLSEDWRNSTIRLLVINPVNENKELIINGASKVLDFFRIKAEIKVINNEFDNRPVYEIIEKESVSSDLVFLGMPEVREDEETRFVQQINHLCQKTGTVVLLKASSYFRELYIGPESKPVKRRIDKEGKAKTRSIQDLEYPADKYLAVQLRDFTSSVDEIKRNLSLNYTAGIFDIHSETAAALEKSFRKYIQEIRSKIADPKVKDKNSAIVKEHLNLLFGFKKSITNLEKSELKKQNEKLETGLGFFTEKIDKLIEELPAKVSVSVPLTDLQLRKGDNINLRAFKLRNRLFRKKPLVYQVRYQRILQSTIDNHLNPLLAEYGKHVEIYALQQLSLYRSLIKKIESGINQYMTGTIQENELMARIEREENEISAMLEEAVNFGNHAIAGADSFVTDKLALLLQLIAHKLGKVHPNALITSIQKSEKEKQEEALNDLNARWALNQTRYVNTLIVEASLLIFRIRLDMILQSAKDSSINAIDEALIKRVEKFRKHLLQFRKDPGSKDLKQFDLREISLQELFDELALETLKKIRNASAVFPDATEIIDLKTLDDFTGSEQERPHEVINISMIRLIDYLIQDLFTETFNIQAAEIANNLNEATRNLRDINRNITFSLGQESSGDEKSGEEMVETLTAEQIQNIEDIQDNISSEVRKISSYIDEKRSLLDSRLSLDSIISNASHLSQYIRIQEGRKRINFIKYRITRLREKLSSQVNQFWYRQSRGMILASRLTSERTNLQTDNSRIRSLVQRANPDDAVYEKLPFYYRQLFSRKDYYYREFWVNREKNISDVQISIEQYKRNPAGGILITGEPDSGKTFFAHHIAEKAFTKKNVYRLQPPIEGCSDKEVFLSKIREVFGLEGELDYIFSNLPPRSVLILDDLELWWERSPNGMEVLNTIGDLMDRHSQNCLFIGVINRYTLKLTDMLSKFSRHFLKVVQMEPFNAEQLQEMIMIRHNSSNIKLKIAAKKRDKVYSWDYARYFSRLYNYTKGIPGHALNSWLTGIRGYEDNSVLIKAPRAADWSVIEGLPSDELILLGNFIFHKRISDVRLERIFSSSNQDINNALLNLSRTGLIQYRENKYWEINPFVKPFIIEQLRHLELI